MNEQEITAIRTEAVAALRAVMGHHGTSPVEIIRAAELLLRFTFDRDMPDASKTGHVHNLL